ncbi:MAG: hypothetical protein J3K34DRAFT_466480 [Monoraphidium minutum]|nr:MAG: hypothetical protein J3K34DRAFT_466480 [Monoraphidium minutum]
MAPARRGEPRHQRRVAAGAAAPLNPFSAALAAGGAALALSGAVPRHDLLFSAAWPTYLWAANRWRFRRNAALGAARPGPLVDEPYAGCAAVLAILLPAAVALLQRGQPGVLAAVAPHLYLTVAQVVCEFFTGGGTTAALPRMLVPVGFNAWRMAALAGWCGAAAGLGPWHVALAAANTAFWGYNLFGFLLLNMLPRYLDPQKCAP